MNHLVERREGILEVVGVEAVVSDVEEVPLVKEPNEVRAALDGLQRHNSVPRGGFGGSPIFGRRWRGRTEHCDRGEVERAGDGLEGFG